MSLPRLLSPRSIATFGGFWAERVVKQCEQMGFTGDVWPVHPSTESIGGRRCFRSIDALPSPPDASFVAVNRTAAICVVGELAQAGAGGAVCFASGFKEAGEEGAQLQDALVAAAGPMPFLGPNCYGLINYVDGALLWPDQHGGTRTERGVAILMQSGNISINMTMTQRGLPIAYLAALGNQAKVGMSDLIAALAATGRVTAIGLLIEGIDDVAAFASATQGSRAAGVPVVALKCGRTSAGAALAMSHTGSLTGSDAVMDAYLKKLGVARVDSLPVLIETLKLLHVHGALPGRDIVSLSCSGGEALMISDAAAGRDLNFRPFSDEDVARIRPTTHPIVALTNPFDYHTFDWGKFDRLEATFTEVLRARYDLGLIVMDLPRADRCDATEWRCGVDAFVAAARRAGARGAVLASLAEGMPEAFAHELAAQSIAPLIGIDESLAAIEGAAFIGRAMQTTWVPLAHHRLRGDVRSLNEWEGKRKLEAHGLAIPAGELVHSEAQAVAAANVVGYPVVVKAVSDRILHKSEAGAVRLGCKTEDEVRRAIHDMASLSDMFLIEEMIGDAVAELIIGVARDPQLGPTLVVGSGGVLVELIADARTLLLPTTETEIGEALRSLKAAPMLDGFRGRPKGDIAAAVAAVMAVARYAEANVATLVELDVNPLMVRPAGKGAIAADVLIRTVQERGRS